MKKISLTIAALCAVCALSYAGSETYSGKEMKQAPLPPPPCHNWTGFYLGGFGGYKFASVDLDLDPIDEWDDFPTDRDNIRHQAPGDVDTSGAEAGGLIGYNWQLQNCIVVGLEANAGYLWLRDSEDTGTFSNPSGGISDKSIQSSFKTHYLATFGPRIGYSIGNWLPYVTGGVAFGDIDFSQRLHNVSSSGSGPYHSSGDVHDNNVGWMVGGGLQYAINEHWSVRAQYQYIDLGDVDFHADGSNGFEDFRTHNEASLKEHNASFAIIYGF